MQILLMFLLSTKEKWEVLCTEEVQEKLEIGNLTQQQLINQTKKIGMELISKSIDLIQRNDVKLIENDPSKKSYFTFPTRQDVLEFKKNGKARTKQLTNPPQLRG